LNAPVAPLLVGLALAGPVLSQEIVAKTTVAGKSIILFDDGGWAYGPEEVSWCGPLDAGIDLCLPTSWMRTPNLDQMSFYKRLFRSNDLVAEVWQVIPMTKDEAEAMPTLLLERIRSQIGMIYLTPIVSPKACGECLAVTSVIGDVQGSQMLLTAVTLQYSMIVILVRSTGRDNAVDDPSASDALVDGITLNLPVYEKAFGHGQ
jgi:hypothetical protein